MFLARPDDQSTPSEIHIKLWVQTLSDTIRVGLCGLLMVERTVVNVRDSDKSYAVDCKLP